MSGTEGEPQCQHRPSGTCLTGWLACCLHAPQKMATGNISCAFPQDASRTEMPIANNHLEPQHSQHRSAARSASSPMRKCTFLVSLWAKGKLFTLPLRQKLLVRGTSRLWLTQANMGCLWAEYFWLSNSVPWGMEHVIPLPVTELTFRKARGLLSAKHTLTKDGSSQGGRWGWLKSSISAISRQLRSNQPGFSISTPVAWQDTLSKCLLLFTPPSLAGFQRTPTSRVPSSQDLPCASPHVPCKTTRNNQQSCSQATGSVGKRDWWLNYLVRK